MNFVNKYGAGFVMGVGVPITIMGSFFDIKDLRCAGWTLIGLGLLWLIIGCWRLYREDNRPRCPHLNYDENSIEHDSHESWAYSDGERFRVTVHCVYATCTDCGKRFLYEAF